MQYCRSDADDFCRKNEDLPEILLPTSDGVSSLPKMEAGAMLQAGVRRDGTVPLQQSDFFHPPYDIATDTSAGIADNQTAAAKRTAIGSLNRPVTTRCRTNDDDQTTGDAANINSNDRDDTVSSGYDVLRFETVTNRDQESVDDGGGCHVASTSPHDVDGPSSSSSFNLDAHMSTFMRSVSPSHIDNRQSPSPPSYEVYARSPGSRRREQRRLDDHEGRRTSLNGRRKAGCAPSSTGTSTQASRKAPRQQVSSSFENLVGSLLASVPPPRRRRPLANSAEIVSVVDRCLPLSGNSVTLSGHGADILPGLAAFMVNRTPTTAADGRVSPILVQPATDPALPSHSSQQIRRGRAKHLLRRCQSCVQWRWDVVRHYVYVLPKQYCETNNAHSSSRHGRRMYFLLRTVSAKHCLYCWLVDIEIISTCLW